MQRPALILAIGLALNLAPRIEASEPTALRPSIGPVSLGDTQARVRERLGNPTSIEDVGEYLGSRWRYKGLDVYFFHDAPIVVGQIESTIPQYCTASGVCPGQTLAVASAKLGSPKGGGSLKDGSNSYAVASEACSLDVNIQKSKVAMLEIRCQL
jgi:hypothetical protein